MRGYETLRQNFWLDFSAADALSRIEGANALHQSFFKGATDGHHFADRLHLHAEVFVGARKFLELPLGNLYDHVVESWFKAGGGFARDVVGNFIERVADGELRGNLGDRKARRFRGQRRRARDARVHLDYDHAAGLGIHSELNVGSAGVDADLADDCDRSVAHGLILAVGEGLRGGDGDGIAGVDAHGIEVLDRADDDDVVFGVTHHLEFEFLPSENRLFDEGFVDRRQIEAARENFD